MKINRSVLKGLGKEGAIIIFIALAVQIGFSMLQPVIQYYIEALENPFIPPPESRTNVRFTPDVIWYIAFNITAFMILRSPSAAIFGRLSDKIGRKRLVVIGLFLYILVGIFLGLSRNALDVVVVRALQGVTSAMVWPVAEAMMMDKVEPSIRTRAMTLYVMSLNLGSLVGPGIGGAVYNMFLVIIESNRAIDILRPTILSPVPLFIVAFVLSILLKETRMFFGEYEENIEIDGNIGALSMDMDTAIRRSINVVFFSGMINGFSVGIIASILIVYISEYIVKEPLYIGGIQLIASLSGLIAAYPIASYTDKKWGKKNMFLFSMAMRSMAMILIGLSKDIISILVGMAFANISFNTGMPSIRAIQADLTKTTIRGRIFGYQQAMFNLGMGLGSLISAYLYIQYAHKYVFGFDGAIIIFVLAAILTLIALIVAYIWLIDTRKIAV